MSEIVKRVAERISDELKLYRQGLDWEDADGPIQRAARAAIEAMREPTDAMADAADNCSREEWEAIIDAALAEQGSPVVRIS